MPNFHISYTVAAQLIGTVLQIFSAFSPMVPANDKVLVAAVIAALQAVQAVLAHGSTPDGNPPAPQQPKV